MSKRPSKNGVPHLSFQAQSGFQFYLTFPKHFSLSAKLPAQIRWSLGHDEPLARELAAHLNHRIQGVIDKTDAFRAQHMHEHVLQDLALCHAEVKDCLQSSRLIWSRRPAPALLAKEDLSKGYERLAIEGQAKPVLFSKAAGEEIIFSLSPSDALIELMRIRFTRFDWPLGTSDQTVASNAAAYICSATTVLENISLTGLSYAKGHPVITAMSLYEYMCFARPDQGRDLLHIPPSLPQSVQAASFRLNEIKWESDRLVFCKKLEVNQRENGVFAATVPTPASLMQLDEETPSQLSIDLQTTSPVVALLLTTFCRGQIEKILAHHFKKPDARSVERSMSEIHDLLRTALGPIPSPELLDPIVAPVQGPEADKRPLEPATLALVTALSTLLPEEQRAKLESIFQTPSANDGIIHTALQQPRGMQLSTLLKEFEERQVKDGAWTNPRTLITMQARLEGIAELLGGHRQISTLTRKELSTLRDQLRGYPKNRHRLRATRNLPLSKLIQDAKFEAINARTAKKFFELARAAIGYAHNQGYLVEDLAAGLTFTTKGAPIPRKRTYTPLQIQKLLNGPVYRLQKPPQWRLDDYRFWLPLLGLYTGARLSELCQLRLNDVREEHGVWLISINRAGSNQLKTDSAERLVPLHSAILDAGFLEYFDMRLSTTGNNLQARLFDTIRTFGVLSPGHTASRWYLGSGKGRGGYLGLCGLAEDRLTFHGLRHTFINQFRRQKLDMLIGKALVGHADRSTTGGYGEVYPARVLKEEIDKIDFEISVEHICYSAYQALQTKQGKYKVGRPVGSGATIAKERLS